MPSQSGHVVRWALNYQLLHCIVLYFIAASLFALLKISFLVFMCMFLWCSFVVSASAVDCLERLTLK